MVQVSIVIVSYNASSFLKLCLESVRAASKQIAAEVIVVDNASSDGAPEMVKETFPEVKLLENKKNLGFSKANNQGAKLAQGKYLLILNPDVLLGEDCLSTVWRFAEQTQDLGAVGVRYINGSGNFLPECKRNFPSRRVALGKLFGDGKGYYADHLDEFRTGEVDILAGAFLFVPRKVYDEVGGFDEDFFMFGEDIALCHSIAKIGYRILYKGDHTILHFKGESSVRDLSYYRNFYGAMNIFHKKIYGEKFFWNLLLSPMIAVLAMTSAIGTRSKKAHDRSNGNLIYVGKRAKVAEELGDMFPEAMLISSKVMPKDWTGIDEVFYDSQSLTMREIIDSISVLGSNDVKKRIISMNAEFFAGSDSSTEKGIAVRL